MTLDEIFNKEGKINGKKLLLFRDSEEYKTIIEETLKHSPMSDSEAIYYYKHKTEPKLCICGQRLKFRFYNNPYYTKYCSSKCEMNDGGYERRRRTIVERYGVDNVLKSSEIRVKRKTTMIERYGSEHALKNDNILSRAKEKCKETKIKKKSDSIFPLFDKGWLEQEYSRKSQQLISKELGCAQSTVGLYINSYNLNTNIHRLQSSLEKQVIDFLLSYNIHSIASNRKLIGKELDVYIPSHNLAIEIDGLHWHSISNYEDDLKIDKRNYHLNKTLMCEKSNIQLLHILDTEWNEYPEKCKSLIKSKLGLNDRIFARHCRIIDINASIGNAFVNENHMQCHVTGGQFKGLLFKDALVAVMQLGRSRFNKQAQYEILRYCSKNHLNVVGGFSKLLKSFSVSGTVISYANKRWSNGNVYLKNDFRKISESSPNYWYWKKYGILESRHKYQKHKLKNILTDFNPNLTESQNMFNNGFGKYYDCGNLVYIKSQGP